MKLLILSDTHGKGYRVEEVLRRHPTKDALLFLGDGLADFGAQPPLGFAAVRGNCDGLGFFGSSFDAPAERLMCFDGVKFLLLHGHSKGVKSGLERAMAYAYDRGADVLLYGHTHIALEKYFPVGSEFCGRVIDRPMYAFNSGSLGEPRDGAPSFGVVEIRNGNILFSHGRLK